jgi:hypothetical protein
MSDVREEPGCYQCGSFTGTTFRLCDNCIARNEQRRDTIRLRRRGSSVTKKPFSVRWRRRTLVTLATLIMASGVAFAAVYF